MKKKLTDTFIKNLKAVSGKRQEFNDNGLYLIMNAGIPSNKTINKKFYFVYYPDGKRKLVPLGVYGTDFTLADAKVLHSQMSNGWKNGIDPSSKLSDITTIGQLANDWYIKYIIVNRKQPKQIKQQIDADIIPTLGKIKLEDITTRKLILTLEKIVERGAKVHANKVLSTLKQMYNYGISKGIVTINPLQNTKAMDIGGKEEPRERNLSMAELKTVWLYLDSKKHRMRKYTVLAIKLLILTGSRLSEVREAQWKEFEIDKNLWTIPKERYKTGIEHKVHLTELIIKILTELKKLAGDSPFLLPSTDKPKEKPLSEKALGRAILRSQDRISIEKWTIHDLRRTFSSRLSDTLDIDVMVIEKLLGHKLPKIMATYQKDEMLGKRQDALEQWSNKIQMLVNNDNVVMLKTS